MGIRGWGLGNGSALGDRGTGMLLELPFGCCPQLLAVKQPFRISQSDRSSRHTRSSHIGHALSRARGSSSPPALFKHLRAHRKRDLCTLIHVLQMAKGVNFHRHKGEVILFPGEHILGADHRDPDALGRGERAAYVASRSLMHRQSEGLCPRSECDRDVTPLTQTP